MSATRCHAVVIGAGHNGLVTAIRLAQSGLKVVVLEARDAPGGLAAVEEFHPGYAAPGPLHRTSHLRAEVRKGLGLTGSGLKVEAPAPVVVPVGDGKAVALHADVNRTADALKALSEAESAGYRQWAGFIGRVRGLVHDLLTTEPPPMSLKSAEDMWDLGKRGLALRRLGRDNMLELMRVLPMCAADWLGETLTHEPIKAALAMPGVLGTFQGPWSAGSAATLLFDRATEAQAVVGGPGALIDALVARATAAGVEIQTGSAVTEIRVEGGRVVGVGLQSGATVDAAVVAASCDPRKAILDLVDPLHVPMELEDQLRVFRCRGTVAKVNLALSGPLEIPGYGDGPIEALALAGDTVDDLERAYDAVKYGEMPSSPALDVVIPTVKNPALAPDGHHVASIVAGFYPYELRAGWGDDARRAVGEAVVAKLAAYVPNIRDIIVGQAVLTPADIAKRYGVTGGHIHHGEHALDQLLFMRPAPSLSHYHTPLSGLYLCGSGSHPGGGITGAPGWLAAGAILAQTNG